MPASGRVPSLDEQIGEWRSYVGHRRTIDAADVAELEDHLREQIAGLMDAGLAADEAFLVAVKRLGDLDGLSREFALEHADRLWKQLVVSPADTAEARAAARRGIVVAFGFAAAAALATQVPALFGVPLEHGYEGVYRRNLSLFVLPVLTAYFAWKRQLDPGRVRWLAVVFAAAAIFANAYPFAPDGSTDRLTALHLPIALLPVVGTAYAGTRWRQVAGRMDFIRFSGELFIYSLLIALSGGVLVAFMTRLFQAIGIDVAPLFAAWLLPCAAGAIVVTAWLVEAKQSVIENMAPVLTRLFTPLYAAVLVAFLGTLLWNGRGVGIDRHVLIAFDLLLVVVMGLLLYSVSARDPRAAPGAFDVMQVVLLVSALLVDVVALWAITARITEFGISPNRAAAFGENVMLMVTLAGSVVRYVRFLSGRGSFTALERSQTEYLPVYAVWAAFVVIAFPPLFGHR